MNELCFTCTTDKPPYAYKCGEEIVFAVTPPAELPPDAVVRWTLAGDGGIAEEGCCDAGPFQVRTRLNEPGCVTLKAWIADEPGSDLPPVFPLETGAGADIAEIRHMSHRPADYDAFWARCRAELEAVPPVLLSAVEKRPPDKHPHHKIYDVRIACAGGVPVSGILTIPPGTGKFPVRVVYQGYGVKSAWTECFPDEICLCINAHGIENDRPQAYYTALSEGRLKGYGFDPEENRSPDTCYFRHMMIRAAQALRYAATLDLWDGQHLTAWGGSQGAVQAMHGTWLSGAATRLEIFVPWLCDLQAERMVRYHNWGDMGRDAVRYFDLSLRAPDVKCPVSVKLGLGDRTSPPGCVCAMFNALPGEKRLCMVQSMGHNNPAPDARTWDVPDEIWENAYHE
ncbi:MAG: acetylxylan esterase [Clostridia bacterium]|nr:acetylxylan esterase [Clostridia bacterium]